LFASFGLQTAAIAATGEGPPGGAPHLAAVESWNGTSWSEVAEVNTPRRELPGAGVQTAGLIISGNIDPPITTNVESWDGSAWTEIANVNTGRNNAASAGTQTSALLIAGNAAPGAQPSVEYWDGTSWTEINDVANASSVSGFGTGTTTAWKAGGSLPGITAVTEEFSAPSLFSKQNLGQVFYNSTSNVFKVTQQPMPGGSWSSGGTMNTARTALGASGTLNAAVAFAGQPPAAPSGVETEEYDGSAWTSSNNMNTARRELARAGTQTAALAASGTVPSVSLATELYNGTTWTSVANVNTAREGVGGCGISTLALIFGGNNPTPGSLI
jgi:hypothetical protein